MYRENNIYSGEGAWIYRNTAEIRKDIRRISDEIKVSNDRLNLRALLLDLVDEGRGEDIKPAIWIPELSAALREAQEAYEHLCTLHDELEILHEELRETRCALKI